MGKIIRSQLYRIFTDKLFYFVAAAMIYFMIDEVLGMNTIIENGVTGSNWLNYGSLTYVGIMAFLMVDVQCRERKDKTINYDVLSGNSRKTVFFGRYFAAAITISVVYFIIGIVPVLIVTALNGWGDDLLLGALPARAAVFLFTAFRLSTEITLIAVVVKKELYSIALCTGIWMVDIVGVEKLDPPIVIKCLFSAFENCLAFFVDEYEATAIDGSIIQYRYDYLPALQVGLDVGYSVIIGAVCLIAAMKIFSKRDFD